MLIKDKDQILDIEPFYIDENGEKVWNVPDDPEQLREMLKDTIRWVVGIRLQREIGNIATDTASTFKAVVLLVKILNNANLKSIENAIANLTDKEKSIWNGLVELAENGYSDSNTLEKKIQKLQELLEWKSKMIEQLDQAETLEELIEIGEQIKL